MLITQFYDLYIVHINVYVCLCVRIDSDLCVYAYILSKKTKRFFF